MKISPTIEEKYSRTRLRGGEVLLTLVGSVGQVAVAPINVSGFNVARAIAVIRSNNIDAFWIALCLRSPLAQHLLNSRANTTVQTTINLRDLKELPIPIPPSVERESLTELLTSLDNRIQLLRETNATLEAIAQALFKSWFVDFDPVHAKVEGRAPEGMDEATAALFPNSFEESKLGMIPKGWSIRSIDEEFLLVMGQSPPGDTYNEIGEGLPFFQGRTDFGFRYPENRKYCSAPGRLAQEGDTLISVRAPVGDINMAWEQSCIGRGVAAVRHNTGYPSFTFYLLNSIQPQIQAFDDSGTVFGSITKKQFEAIRIGVPSLALIEKFEDKATPLDKAIKNNTDQARTLAAIRDALLPRLISGKLRLPEFVDNFCEIP